MKFTRKDVSELLAEINGGPDVSGYTTSAWGSTQVTLSTSSGSCTYWLIGASPTCEDGSACGTEDLSACAPPAPRC